MVEEDVLKLGVYVLPWEFSNRLTGRGGLCKVGGWVCLCFVSKVKSSQSCPIPERELFGSLAGKMEDKKKEKKKETNRESDQERERVLRFPQLVHERECRAGVEEIRIDESESGRGRSLPDGIIH